MIQKQFRLPLALASALGLLAGLAYWDDWQTKKDEEVKKAEGQLFTFKQEEVTEIEYHRVDAEKKQTYDIKAKRTGPGEWVLESPIQVKGDAMSIDNFLRQITEYQAEDRVPHKMEHLADYGLQDPSTKIKMIMKDKAVTLLLGNKTPVGYSMYSMVEGNQDVIVGSQYLLTAAVKTLHDFRNKALVDMLATDFSAIKVVRKNSVFDAAKDKDGSWKESNGTMKLDQVAMAEFLSDLRGQNVQTFVDAPTPLDQEPFKKAKPDTTVVISFKNNAGASQTMTVVSAGEDTLVTFDANQQIFKLNKEAYSKFDRTPMFFYDRVLAEINASHVVGLSVQGHKFTKSKDKWTNEKGESSEAFNEKTNALVNSLSTGRGDTVAKYDAQKFAALGEPAYTIGLQMKDEKGIESQAELKFWKDKADPNLYHVVSQQKAENRYEVSKLLVQEIDGVMAVLPNKASANAAPQGSSNESASGKSPQG